jgi:hypothetical protein
MVANNTEGVSALSSLEDWPKSLQATLAGLASLALAASVAYETGYFSVIGWKYQGVLSTSDYLASALDWLPYLVVLIGVSAAAVLTLLPHFLRLTAMLRFYLGSRVWKRCVVGAVAILVLATLTVVLAVPAYWLFLSAPTLAAFHCIYLLKRRIVVGLHGLLAMGAYVIVALYLSGVGSAHRDILAISNAYIIVGTLCAASLKRQTNNQVARLLLSVLLTCGHCANRTAATDQSSP